MSEHRAAPQDYLAYAAQHIASAIEKRDDAPMSSIAHERSALLALRLERIPTLQEWNASWPGQGLELVKIAAPQGHCACGNRTESSSGLCPTCISKGWTFYTGSAIPSAAPQEGETPTAKCRDCGETEAAHPHFGSFAYCATFTPPMEAESGPRPEEEAAATLRRLEWLLGRDLANWRLDIQRAHDSLRALLDQLQTLREEKRTAEVDGWCDACCGTGKSADGTVCMCGGTGKAAMAVTYLRERLLELLVPRTYE